MLVGLTQFRMPPGWVLTVVEVVSAFAIATLSYRFIELPFLQRRYSGVELEHSPAGGGSALAGKENHGN
jgi:peptidoglycan/LPS O-acetylase OafA/YrhL